MRKRRKKYPDMEQMNFNYEDGKWDYPATVQTMSKSKTTSYQNKKVIKSNKRKFIILVFAVFSIYAALHSFFSMENKRIKAYITESFQLQNSSSQILNEIIANRPSMNVNNLNAQQMEMGNILLKATTKLSIPKGFEQFQFLLTRSLTIKDTLIRDIQVGPANGAINSNAINVRLTELKSVSSQMNQELIQIFDAKGIKYTLRPDGFIQSYNFEKRNIWGFPLKQ